MSVPHGRRLPQSLAVIFALLATAAACLGTGPAQAGIIFGYESVCAPLPCPDVGLGNGDPVTGIIEFATGAVAPNAILSAAAVVGFSLDFGIIDIDFASAFGFSFSGILDSTAQGFTAFTMIVSNSFGVPGGLLFLDLIGWAGGAGACLTADCADFILVDGSFGLDASIARVGGDPDPIPIPEPGMALLLLIPLALLARPPA